MRMWAEQPKLLRRTSRAFAGDPGDRTAALQQLVLQQPTIFGRLIYIACLWNPVTGRYERDLPSRVLGPETDAALADWHNSFFFEWLTQSLEQKRSDVALYWTGIGGSRGQVDAIRELGEGAIPAGARAEERQAFLADLALVGTSL